MDGTTLFDGAGAVARVATTWKTPEDSNKFFGWIDYAGDPNTVRYEDIVGLVRDTRTMKFVIILKNCGFVPQISDADAFRLMRRMGWKSDSVINS